MADGVTKAESMLHLKEEEEEEDDKKGSLRESGEDKPSGSLLNHIFSNLVSNGEADHEEKGGKEEDEEKGGGLFDNIISNLVSRSSKKEGEKEHHEVSQAGDGGGTTEDQVQKKQKVAVVDEESEKVKAEAVSLITLFPSFLHLLQMLLLHHLTKPPFLFTPSSMIKGSKLVRSLAL